MPQFEMAFYFSQTFWMIISFGFMYLMVAYFIMPMFEDIFSERENLIQKHLSDADRLNKRAEKLGKEHEEFLLSTKEQKARMIKKTYEKMNEIVLKSDAKYDKQMNDKIDKMQSMLQDVKKDLSQQSDEIVELLASRLYGKFEQTTKRKRVKK